MTLAPLNRLTRLALVAAVSAAPLMAGCVRRQNSPPAALDDTPVRIDAAMERRAWGPSSAMYSNTAVAANNTGFDYVTKPDMPLWMFGFADLPVFLTNVVVLPYSLVRTPPGTQVEYRAETVPTTSNGNPPWPPSQENDLTVPPSPESSASGDSSMNSTTVAPAPTPSVPPERPLSATARQPDTFPRSASPATEPTTRPSERLAPTTRPMSMTPPPPTTAPARTLNK